MPIVRLVNPRHSHGSRVGQWRSSAAEGVIDMAHKRYRVHRHHSYFGHHRNPFNTEVMGTAAWAMGGGVLATWVPTVVASGFNSGWGGVAATGVTAFALGWAGERFVSAKAGNGLLIGGLVATFGKAVAQLLGKQLVTFQLGQYTNTWFGPPYNSQGILQTTANPNAPVLAAAGSSTSAAMHGLLGRSQGGRMSRSRFSR
jgi:hypothetical protein